MIFGFLPQNVKTEAVAVAFRPSSRTVGRISASIPRLISEYSICRAAIGCTV
jgi:hypothetical protein